MKDILLEKLESLEDRITELEQNYRGLMHDTKFYDEKLDELDKTNIVHIGIMDALEKKILNFSDRIRRVEGESVSPLLEINKLREVIKAFDKHITDVAKQLTTITKALNNSA